MADSTIFREAIKKALEGKGFLRKGLSWFWSNNDVIHVINLQRSSFSSQYYLNFGVYVMALGNQFNQSKLPKEYQCHARVRVSCKSSLGVVRLHQFLDLDDTSIGDTERYDAIFNVVGTDILPYMAQCKSIESMKDLFHSGGLDEYFKQKCLVDFLAVRN